MKTATSLNRIELEDIGTGRHGQPLDQFKIRYVRIRVSSGGLHAMHLRSYATLSARAVQAMAHMPLGQALNIWLIGLVVSD